MYRRIGIIEGGASIMSELSLVIVFGNRIEIGNIIFTVVLLLWLFVVVITVDDYDMREDILSGIRKKQDGERNEDMVKIKSFAVKVLSGILAVSLLAVFVTGCGKKKDGTAEMGNGSIYKQEEFEGVLKAGEEPVSIEYVGNKVRVIARSSRIGNNSKCRYITFNLDGTDIQSADIGSGEGCYAYEGVFDDKGCAYVRIVEKHYSEEGEGTEDSLEENKEYLVKLDASGKEIYKKDLSEEFATQASNIHVLMWSGKYGLVVATPKGIRSYDDENSYETIKPNFISNLYGVTKVSDSRVLLEYDIDGSVELFDLDTKEVKRDLECFSNSNIFTFYSGAGNLYAVNNLGLYKCNKNDAKKDKLINFNDSNIDRDRIWKLTALSDTEFIVGVLGTMNTDDAMIVKYTKVD